MKDQIRHRLWEIDYVRLLVRHARETAAGALNIEEADEAYRRLTRGSLQ